MRETCPETWHHIVSVARTCLLWGSPWSSILSSPAEVRSQGGDEAGEPDTIPQGGDLASYLAAPSQLGSANSNPGRSICHHLKHTRLAPLSITLSVRDGPWQSGDVDGDSGDGVGTCPTSALPVRTSHTHPTRVYSHSTWAAALTGFPSTREAAWRRTRSFPVDRGRVPVSSVTHPDSAARVQG